MHHLKIRGTPRLFTEEHCGASLKLLPKAQATRLWLEPGGTSPAENSQTNGPHQDLTNNDGRNGDL